MKSKDSAGIAQGEFVQDFYSWKERHRKQEHFWIVDGAEEFLKLSHRSNENKAGFLNEIWHFLVDEVD